MWQVNVYNKNEQIGMITFASIEEAEYYCDFIKNLNYEIEILIVEPV